MDSASVELADLDRLSVAELKALLQEKHAQLVVKDAQILDFTVQIEALKLQILKLRGMQFGSRSEKRAKEIEQLEFWVEALETAAAERSFELDQQPGAVPALRSPKPRREFPAHLPRETLTIAPRESSCPDCTGELKYLGEDVTEFLEIEPVRFKVIRQVRTKLACAHCDKIVQAPAPARPIERGMAGPGLLAHVLCGKYGDHIPLYRQAEIYAREGVELDRSQMAEWAGLCTVLLTSVTAALKAYVLAADVVHADDTPLPVLAPGRGKTKIGRMWTYVVDGRPAGGEGAPAVWHAYSADRRGEHPQEHLKGFTGILQADGYAGFSKIYDGGQVLEAACWAHARRKFVDLHELHKLPVAKEALDQIGDLYAIEKEIRGRSPDERRAARQEYSRPVLDKLKIWFEDTLRTLSQKSATAKAIRYSLTRWEALCRYCDDGRIEIDNNAAERSLRAIALGRKNFMFAGSDVGGERAAALYSLVGTAKLNGIDPEAYLRELLTRISDHPINRIEELLPWNLCAAKSKALTAGDAILELPAQALSGS
jgi:transposase